MDRKQQLKLFHLLSQNVRRLDTAFKQVRRVINAGLLRNDVVLVDVQTKTLVFLYACWTEALFYKLIHTPHCFTLAEIQQIKRQVKASGITSGWKKAIDLALRHVNSRAGDIQNRKQRLERLLRQYVEEPSQLRNRIAHGQWVHALNNEGTDVNQSLTTSLGGIDFLEVERLRAGCTALSTVIESLFESPQRAFHADYYTVLANVEERLREMRTYTVQEHISRIKRKQAQ